MSERDLAATFLAAFREVRPRTPTPEMAIEFYPFTHLNSTIRRRENRLHVRISDLLAGAPEPVIEALAQILLRKLYRRPIPAGYERRYRQFVGRREIAAKAELIRGLRGRKRLSTSTGRHFDLAEVFQRLNLEFFQGWLAQPELSWGPAAARRNLAHFDSAHNAILVSRIFDRPQAPAFVLDYVMYHEMLHLKYPVVRRNGRRCVHSAEFRVEERRFPRWQEAEAWLKTL